MRSNAVDDFSLVLILAPVALQHHALTVMYHRTVSQDGASVETTTV